MLDADALLERRRLKRRLILWRALFVVAVLGMVLVAVEGTDSDGMFAGDRIARLEVNGVIAEDPGLDRALANLAKDDHVKAVIVRINSPGGTTFGGETLYTGLRRVAQHKPVVAVIGTLGASAGYLSALAGDRIFARETSLTGSIGVILQTAEFSKLMEKLGVSAESITSGPLKDQPSPFRKLSPEGRQSLQQTIDGTYSWFVSLVSDRRKLPREAVLQVADGRVLTGRAALDDKLIDELGGETEALAWLASARGIDAHLPVRRVKVEDASGWLGEASSSIRKIVLSERLTLDGLVSLWHPDR